MSREEREAIREAARAVKTHALADSMLSPFMDWKLQTSNSFRRIGQRGDGDVLCGTKHPIDGHSDLLAAPGVLKYIVAAQPRAVIQLLNYIDVLEDKLGKAQILCDKIADVEKRLDAVADTISTFGAAVMQLAYNDPEAVTKVRTLVDQILTSLREVHR